MGCLRLGSVFWHAETIMMIRRPGYTSNRRVVHTRILQNTVQSWWFSTSHGTKLRSACCVYYGNKGTVGLSDTSMTLRALEECNNSYNRMMNLSHALAPRRTITLMPSQHVPELDSSFYLRHTTCAPKQRQNRPQECASPGACYSIITFEPRLRILVIAGRRDERACVSSLSPASKTLEL